MSQPAIRSPSQRHWSALADRRDALLAAVPHGEAGLLAVGMATGRLDLDHLGAEIGHEHAGDRSRDTIRQINDLQLPQDFHRASLPGEQFYSWLPIANCAGSYGRQPVCPNGRLRGLHTRRAIARRAAATGKQGHSQKPTGQGNALDETGFIDFCSDHRRRVGPWGCDRAAARLARRQGRHLRPERGTRRKDRQGDRRRVLQGQRHLHAGSRRRLRESRAPRSARSASWSTAPASAAR